MKILILRKYFYKELILFSFSFFFLFIFLLLLTQIPRLLQDVYLGGITLFYFLSYLVVFLNQSLVIVFPLAVFLALLMVLVRMYMDQEISVIFSLGCGPWFFLRGLLFPVVLLVMMQFILSFFLLPMVFSVLYDYSMSYSLADITFNQLTDVNVMHQQQGVYFFSFDYNKMQDVLSKTLMLKEQDNGQIYVYLDALSRPISGGSLQSSVIQSSLKGESGLYLNIQADKLQQMAQFNSINFNFDFNLPQSSVRALGLFDLLQDSNFEAKREINIRISYLIQTMVLPAIGLASVKLKPRAAKYYGIFLKGLILYVIYLLITLWLLSKMEMGSIILWILYGFHFVLAALSVAVYWVRTVRLR